MKKKKDLLEAKNPNRDRLDKLLESNFLATYVNLSLQGLISLGVAMLIGWIIRIIWKDIPIWLLVPIIFAMMILFSVIFSKKLSQIQIGYKVQEWYLNFLKKYI